MKLMKKLGRSPVSHLNSVAMRWIQVRSKNPHIHYATMNMDKTGEKSVPYTLGVFPEIRLGFHGHLSHLFSPYVLGRKGYAEEGNTPFHTYFTPFAWSLATPVEMGER